MLESLFHKVPGLKTCNFIKKRLQDSFVSVKFSKFLNTFFFTEYIQWLLLQISHEFSLNCIWEQWMVSFRGTYWLSSANFILLHVFLFFLFLSFFLFFLFVDSTTCWGIEVSLLLIKIKQWSSSKVSQWSFEGFVASALIL